MSRLFFTLVTLLVAVGLLTLFTVVPVVLASRLFNALTGLPPSHVRDASMGLAWGVSLAVALHHIGPRGRRF